jgi:hypothetical protein
MMSAAAWALVRSRLPPTVGHRMRRGAAPSGARFCPMTCDNSVELPGIEPGSYGIPSRLLRAQFAMPLLGSPGHTNQPG